MRFLPVVERELRVTSRHWRTYWTRFGAGAAAVTISVWIWGIVTVSGPSELAMILFQSLGGLGFIYSLTAGVAVTSDTLSEEKREGTLGLLFLTDLKGYDVVLGKMVASSVNSYYRLLAIFPVMAIPLLLGGLTGAEFWRMALALADTLFFSLSAGMAVSACSRHSRRSALGTLGLIALISAAPPGIVAYGSAYHHWGRSAHVWMTLSPGFAYVCSGARLYLTESEGYWASIVATNLWAWLFLGTASLVVRRTWQDRPEGTRKLRWKDRWTQWCNGSPALRAAYRSRLLDINPYFWLAGRDRLRPAYVLGFLGILGTVWLWALLRHRETMLNVAMYTLTAIVLHGILRFWVASESCRTLAEDRRMGSIELILSTPLPVREILKGQLLALKRQFGPGLIVVLGADLLLFLAGRQDTFSSDANEWALWMLGLVTMLLADLYALSWVGMWLGLTSKRSSRAAGGAVMRILVLPWVLIFALLTGMMLLRVELADPGFKFFLFLWLAVGLAVDGAFFAWAWSNLHGRFRDVVTHRFDSRRGEKRR